MPSESLTKAELNLIQKLPKGMGGRKKRQIGNTEYENADVSEGNLENRFAKFAGDEELNDYQDSQLEAADGFEDNDEMVTMSATQLPEFEADDVANVSMINPDFMVTEGGIQNDIDTEMYDADVESDDPKELQMLMNDARGAANVGAHVSRVLTVKVIIANLTPLKVTVTQVSKDKKEVLIRQDLGPPRKGNNCTSVKTIEFKSN